MKNAHIRWMLIILICPFHQMLTAQNKPSAHKLQEYNKQLLITQKTAKSVDTTNLIDIISGDDKEAFMIDLNGDTLNHKSFDQKVILLDFWYLACKPCIVEMPGLDLLAKKVNSPDFEIITFAIDDGSRIKEKLLSKRNFNFRIIPNVAQANRVYPFKLLLNKENQIIDYKAGGNVGDDSINKLLNNYLPKVKKELQE